MCGDGAVVKEMHHYNTIEFHQNNLKLLEKTLKYIRNHVHDTYSLCSYTAQLSRLQIESYIHQLFMRSTALCELDNSMPVTGKYAVTFMILTPCMRLKSVVHNFSFTHC